MLGSLPLSIRYLWFLIAQVISGIGDSFRRVTIMLWVFQASNGSGVAIATIAIAETVPYVLLSPFAGVLVDQWNRKHTLITCDLARFALSILILISVLSNALVVCYILISLSTVCSVFADIATSTLIPRLVPDESLERGNAFWTVAQQFAFVIGPAFAALVFSSSGPTFALGLDALSFAMSALILAVILHKFNTKIAPQTHEGIVGFKSNLLQGLQFLIRTPLIKNLFIISALRSVAAGINSTIMVFFIVQVLNHAPSDIAWLGSTNGIIQILIGGFIAFTVQRTNLQVVFLFGAASAFLGGVIVSAALTLPILIMGVILTSFGDAPINIAQGTLEQRNTPSEMLGRVRGTIDTFSTLLYLIATSISGLLVLQFGSRVLLTISAFTLGLVFLIVVFRIRPTLARLGLDMPIEPSNTPRHDSLSANTNE
jgi:MFS transporter, DHA3 family, macrolide efflux protein